MTQDKTYQFTRKATYIQYGVVTAPNEEIARRMIINDEYDDIYDVCEDEEDNTTIEIEET